MVPAEIRGLWQRRDSAELNAAAARLSGAKLSKAHGADGAREFMAAAETSEVHGAGGIRGLWQRRDSAELNAAAARLSGAKLSEAHGADGAQEFMAAAEISEVHGADGIRGSSQRRGSAEIIAAAVGLSGAKLSESHGTDGAQEFMAAAKLEFMAAVEPGGAPGEPEIFHLIIQSVDKISDPSPVIGQLKCIPVLVSTIQQLVCSESRRSMRLQTA
jgi:hypothetical protein